jgi:hypothetical protein
VCKKFAGIFGKEHQLAFPPLAGGIKKKGGSLCDCKKKLPAGVALTAGTQFGRVKQ